MRDRASFRKPAILSRRLLSLVVRALAITSMSFAVAFGFLSGATSPLAHYDPNSFAIGVAALFGAACGGMGILLSRIRQMKAELRGLEARLDEAEDRHWEFKEAQERAKSFFEAQGDVIVRRDGNGAITYANDAFCALAGRPREALIGADFALAVEAQGETTPARRRHADLRPEDRRGRWRALDRLAGSHRAFRYPQARCKASAATSPTASMPNGRWPMRAIRPKPRTAPSRASWPWSRMRSARRLTASSAWPTCWATPRYRPSRRLISKP